MDPVLKKLQARPGTSLVVLDAPDEVRGLVVGWSADRTVHDRLRAKSEFVLVFVTTRKAIATWTKRIVPKLADDALLWFAYPKGSSKRYPDAEVRRDDAWGSLGDLGFEPVRQVAIDEDWSAVRFRKAEQITTLTRAPQHAISAAGRARARKRPAAVEQFLEASRADRRPLIEAVDETIRRAAPQLKVGIDGRFLGYGPFHYRYPTGREGDTFVVAMMDGAQALSIYVLGGDGGQYLVEANATRLGKVSVGKSCIRVRRLEHLDLDVLGELVATAADQHADDLT